MGCELAIWTKKGDVWDGEKANSTSDTLEQSKAVPLGTPRGLLVCFSLAVVTAPFSFEFLTLTPSERPSLKLVLLTATYLYSTRTTNPRAAKGDLRGVYSLLGSEKSDVNSSWINISKQNDEGRKKKSKQKKNKAPLRCECVNLDEVSADTHSVPEKNIYFCR